MAVMLITVYKGEFRYVVHQQRAGNDLTTTQLRKALATLLQLHLNMCLKYCFYNEMQSNWFNSAEILHGY